MVILVSSVISLASGHMWVAVAEVVVQLVHLQPVDRHAWHLLGHLLRQPGVQLTLLVVLPAVQLGLCPLMVCLVVGMLKVAQ